MSVQRRQKSEKHLLASSKNKLKLEWKNMLQNICSAWNQCGQIGRFFEVPGYKFSFISSPNIW